MNDFLETDRRNIWHPFTPLAGASDPVLITDAKGVYLHTSDGRKIIDAISSWWVNIHGHSNPVIAKALAEQASTLEHVIFAGFTHKPAIRLSENLLQILPESQCKIFFSDNGSTAVEVAIKMALQYFHNQGIEKKKIIALQGAYHGDTFGAMSVGARGLFTNAFAPYLFDVSFIEFPTPENEEKAFAEFQRYIKTGDAAVFIFEPLVQAAAGMRMYSPSFLDRLITEARKHDVICIADEVFTGFGRTGKLFASEYLQNSPDIMALSKGLTGGTLPMGITSCNKKITEAFNTSNFYKTFFHGHSYTANPLACATANASFELLMDPACLEARIRIEQKHKKFKKEIEGHPKLKEVRMLGTILAIEIKTDETRYDHDLRTVLYPFFLDRNLLLRPLGNIIYVLPPYVITNEELDKIYAGIRELIDTVL